MDDRRERPSSFPGEGFGRRFDPASSGDRVAGLLSVVDFLGGDVPLLVAFGFGVKVDDVTGGELFWFFPGLCREILYHRNDHE